MQTKFSKTPSYDLLVEDPLNSDQKTTKVLSNYILGEENAETPRLHEDLRL